MPDTNFIPRSTNITANWLNQANRYIFGSATAASLRSLDKTVYTRTRTLGYYTAGDGGEGDYYLDPSDTTSADDGGTVFVAGDGGRWKLAKGEGLKARQFGINPSQTDTVNAARLTVAMAACNGNTLLFSAGIYNIAAVTVAKTTQCHLVGEFDSYGTSGTVLNYTGSATFFQVGVNDGNPDSTGFTKSVWFRHLKITTAAGVTAINFTNATLCGVDHCSIAGFSGKQIILHETVLTTIEHNDIRGAGGTASGNYSIYLDTVQYFGNFLTTIRDNHLYQTNWLVRIAGGRGLVIKGNVCENITGWTVSNPEYGGMFIFETAGYLDVVINNNYCEGQRGWCLYSNPSSPFTGAVMNLVFTDNSFWGSGDAANPNPGVGNLPRTKVLSQEIRGNLIIDAQINTASFLGLSAGQYFPSTTIYDSTTIVTDANTNIEYEDSLVYSLKTSELLKAAGDFQLATGTAGTFPNLLTTATPSGWTNDITGATLSLVQDTVGPVIYTAGSGSTGALFHSTVTTLNTGSTTHYAMCVTAKGWVAVKVAGTTVYDSGSSISAYTTIFFTFTVAPNTASVVVQFLTNASNAFNIAEARIWRIGIAEYSVPGPAAMNGALANACRRLMKRGIY